jgi:hypothetical protein
MGLSPKVDEGVLGHQGTQGKRANVARAVNGGRGPGRVHAIRSVEDAVEVTAYQEGATVSRQQRA